MTSSVVGPRRKLQSTSQSQTCAKTRSWSLFGGLPPIWSTTAFWIPEKPLHLRCMLSELMRCTKNYKAYSRHWSRVQFSHSVVSNSVTPWTAARQTSLSITNSWSLLKLMSIELVMPSNLILWRPLPSVLFNIKVFSHESALCIRWPKYWSFSFNISPSNEYSVLISFRIDRLDLLAVQGTLKSLFKHHSSKASVLWHSAFFIVQITHPYMTTGKTIALTRQNFVGKIMFLLFNMLFRLIIAFLLMNKNLLISWLKSPSAVLLEPNKIVCHYFDCFPMYFPWSDVTRYYDLSFLNVEF